MLELLVCLFGFEFKDEDTAFESFLSVLAVCLCFGGLLLELDVGFLVDGCSLRENFLLKMMGLV